MSHPLRAKAWPPYVVGAAIGALSWFSFASADKPLGITTAFENTAALIGRAIAGERAVGHAYYREHHPKIDWEWALVLGVLVGSLLSASASGDRERGSVPDLWKSRFGPSAAARLIAAFAGGMLMMFGARLARGCTSGHGISGALQLAVSSWLFVLVFFSTAIAVALAMYGREGRRLV